MKNLKSINCRVLITATLLLATYAPDKAAPAAVQQAAQAAAPPKTSATKSPAGAAEKMLASFAAVLSSSAPQGLTLTVEPKVIEIGSPCLFTVAATEALSSLAGSFRGKKVFFNPDQSRKTWYGLAGVGLE